MAEKEYIERGALMVKLVRKFYPTIPTGSIAGHFCEAILDTINYQCAADVVEVVHARWEKIHDDPRVNKYRCTNCKAEKMRDNYCPNCGAKMDGATDNNVGDKKEGD